MITSLEFKDAVAQPTPTNHIFAVDVSGSMYGSLPKIREHLKSNLALLVKEDDTVSILYFSSKGQFGTVFAGEPIRHLSDLSAINSAIDRYLKPMGLTGFVEPLRLACETAESIKNGNTNNLIFMTDGYDNQWTEVQILTETSRLHGVFENITIIEYGYYCNRPLLEKMATAVNAMHVFAEGFTQYEPAVEEILTSNTSKRNKVKMPDGTATAVYIEGSKVNTQVVDQGYAMVPAHISKVWAVSESENVGDISDEQQLYIILFCAIQNMQQDLAWDILHKLGDVAIIKQYANCFTKQDYSELKNAIENAVVDKKQRFVDGVNYNLVVPEDAYTVLDLLNRLVEGEAQLIASSPYFQYSRIGAGTVQREDNTIDTLADEMAEATTKEERKAIAIKMANANEWTPEFVKNNQEENVLPLHALVYNESRPNVSVRTTTNGKVAVPKEVRSEHPTLPESIDTWIYRNYTIIKDGIVNLKTLPVRINKSTEASLDNNGVSFFAIGEELKDGTRDFAIDLMSVPVVNRAMVKGVEAAEFFDAHIEMQRQKARQKVLKFYRDEIMGPVNAEGLKQLYGDEAALYLSAKGIRDYGFSPAVDSVDSSDFYYSKELNVKIKGLSSLPSVNAVLKKIADNEEALKAGKKEKKFNEGDMLIKEAIDFYLNFVDSELVKKSSAKDTLIKEWLKAETKDTIERVRAINLSLSKVLYGIVAGHGWFSDLDFEDPTMVINNKGTEYTVTAALEQKEIKV